MTSNLKYTKHYIELGEPYQLVLPLSFGSRSLTLSFKHHNTPEFGTFLLGD